MLVCPGGSGRGEGGRGLLEGDDVALSENAHRPRVRARIFPTPPSRRETPSYRSARGGRGIIGPSSWTWGTCRVSSCGRWDLGGILWSRPYGMICYYYWRRSLRREGAVGRELLVGLVSLLLGGGRRLWAETSFWRARTCRAGSFRGRPPAASSLLLPWLLLR